MFSKDFDRSILAQFNRFFPQKGLFLAFIFHLCRKLGLYQTLPNLWIIENSKDFIKQYSSGDNEQNVLQNLVKAVDSVQFEYKVSEIFSHVFVIIVAGFDSPSTVLSYCMHTLAHQPKIQEQFYNEILINPIEDDYDLSKLVYLDAFIKEVLRMNPTAIQFVNRRCIEDTQVNGYNIPKGTIIQADVLSIHFNETLWGPLSVDEFHLERHFTKRHPLALLSFGAGPRQCLGLRFAFLEMKMFLIEIIKSFHIESSEQHDELIMKKEELTISPDQVWIKLKKRFH